MLSTVRTFKTNTYKHSGTGVRFLSRIPSAAKPWSTQLLKLVTLHQAKRYQKMICFWDIRKHPTRPRNASASTPKFWQSKHPSAQWSLLWAACCSRVSIIFSVSMLRIRLRISYRCAGVQWGFSHLSWVSSTGPHWCGTCAIVS